MSAVIRGASELGEVRDLLRQLEMTSDSIVEAKAVESEEWRATSRDVMGTVAVSVSLAELLSILQARHAAILLKLENKGIQVKPDAEPSK